MVQSHCLILVMESDAVQLPKSYLGQNIPAGISSGQGFICNMENREEGSLG